MITLIKDNITRNKYKLYKHGDFFILTDTDNEYIASVDYTESTSLNAILINGGHSLLKGHYKILLTEILANTNFKYVFSGDSVSNDARKFWIKMMTSGDSKANSVVLVNNKIIVPFDSKEDCEGSNTRFGITYDKDFLLETLNNSDLFYSNRYCSEFYLHEYYKRYDSVIIYPGEKNINIVHNITDNYLVEGTNINNIKQEKEMKTFREFIAERSEIKEAKGDTDFHKYSENTMDELLELLKHHEEDLAELEASDKECEGKDEILKDIEEIKTAIAAKKEDVSEALAKVLPGKNYKDKSGEIVNLIDIVKSPGVKDKVELEDKKGRTYKIAIGVFKSQYTLIESEDITITESSEVLDVVDDIGKLYRKLREITKKDKDLYSAVLKYSREFDNMDEELTNYFKSK